MSSTRKTHVLENPLLARNGHEYPRNPGPRIHPKSTTAGNFSCKLTAKVVATSRRICTRSVGLHPFLFSFCPPCQCGFSSDFPAPFRSKSFTPSPSAELAQMNGVGISFLLLAHVRLERYVEECSESRKNC